MLMPDDAALQALLDKQEITEQIHRYARAVDRIDEQLGYSVFHEDAEVDYGEFYHGPARELMDRICAQHRHAEGHAHQVSNVLINLEGDRAGSETYVTMQLRFARDDQVYQVSMSGRYIDRWSRRAGRWAIDKRTVLSDFDEVRPVTSQGVVGNPGRRDREDPSYPVLQVES